MGTQGGRARLADPCAGPVSAGAASEDAPTAECSDEVQPFVQRSSLTGGGGALRVQTWRVKQDSQKNSHCPFQFFCPRCSFVYCVGRFNVCQWYFVNPFFGCLLKGILHPFFLVWNQQQGLNQEKSWKISGRSFVQDFSRKLRKVPFPSVNDKTEFEEFMLDMCFLFQSPVPKGKSIQNE